MAEVIFKGQAIHVTRIERDIAEFSFNLDGTSVNKFNTLMIDEVHDAVKKIKDTEKLRGILVTSAKDGFIVGADVMQFMQHFKKSDSELKAWLKRTHDDFNALEDLDIPSVVAINGVAFGGGFEFCLAMTYRVMASDGEVGLPETKLGIYPGWGGTIRLPRLIGADNAIEWIATGAGQKAPMALKTGAVDAVVPPAKLREAALDLLQRAIDGELDWQAKRLEKTVPLKLKSPIEAAMVFEGGKAMVGSKAGANYPAPVAAIDAMQRSAGLARDQAIDIELDGFIRMTRTPTAENLVSIFLSDQFNKKKIKKLTQDSPKIKRAAVLGAGIMGGGIAYQSASKGTPIIMKDINPQAIELGLAEAQKLLGKQLGRGKITVEQMGKIVSTINPTLSYGDFQTVDILVEAVVESEKIKKSVLSEVEKHVRPDTVIASNTSTISISSLAEGLQRPQNFCGMHFFNPVHMMPLVEVIRGKMTSDETIARTCAYAVAMGKTPVVVDDCAGFLVNRILFPYFFGLFHLMADGIDFRRVDKVMEKFGWPMGPAYLGDVVGLDTAVHAAAVMATAYPERMGVQSDNAMHIMVENGRFGQKNGAGFYRYEIDRKGKPKKIDDPEVASLIAKVVKQKVEVSDDEIVERMMLPMINEAVLCLAEKIVESPMELDLGLVYGIGFPAFRGGALKYADALGADRLIALGAKYRAYGKIYEPADLLQKMAHEGSKFYQI